MRYIICYCLFFASCTKFLDKKPDASQAVPTTVTDLQAVLDYSLYMNQQHTPYFGEATVDDYYITDDTYDGMDQDPQSVYRWQRQAYTFDNDWNTAYHAVYHANFCLEGLAKIPVTSLNADAWNNVKGSALFFRAYYYLGILVQHGKVYDETTASSDLGIALRVSSDFNLPTVRSTVQDCYHAIVSDVQAAVALLPDQPLNRMRPSKGAAYALLARTYLSIRKYDSAFYYSNQALQFHHALLDYNAAVPPPADNPEILFETSMLGSIGLLYPGAAIIDSNLVSSYLAGDLRPARYFEMDGSMAYFTGSYTGNPGFLFTGFATDELLLMRAECLARLGQITTAMDDLNALLITRWDNTMPYIPLTAGDAEEALDIILRERRKCLLMRGLRFMDIKRLNKEGRNIILHRTIHGEAYTLLPESNYYTLPLPQDIIDVTGIPQN